VKVTTEPRENRQLALTIEVDPDRVEKALAKAAKKIAREANIPGFRKGKAPRNVIEQMFGKGAILNEALDELGQAVYLEALEEAGVEPYAAGSLEDIKTDPLVLTMVVPLYPEVDLGDYRSVRVPYEEPQVDEHQVEHQIGHLREQHAMLEPAPEETAADWEYLATFNIDANVEDKPFITEEDADVMLEQEPLDEGVNVLPGFEAQVLGMKVGEERSFSLPVPEDERYDDFAGKTADFSVKLTALQKRTLPDADDALAQTVGDFETIAALRDDLRVKLRENLARQARDDYADRVLDKLLETARVEYPPQVLEDEIDEMVERAKESLRSQGLQFEQYLNMLKQDEQTYRNSLRERAQERVRRGLVLTKIVDLEGLEVEPGEVDARYEVLGQLYDRLAARDSMPPKDKAHRDLHIRLLSDKAIERLIAIGKGEAPELADAVETEAAA
jgi:trigger factor